MNGFQPAMFIGVGALNCFYTLRETYLHEWYEGNRRYTEVRSRHHYNLSQDAAEAVTKATEAAAREGLPMRSTVEGIQQELNEIKRAGAEEMARRQRAIEEREAQWAAERVKTDEQLREVIAAGFFPFGRFVGEAFEKADPGYINWMMDKVADFEDGSMLRLIAEKLIADYPELRLPVPVNGKYMGAVGARCEFSATVVRTFCFDSQFGRVYIVKMVTPDGCCVVSKGRFFAEVGETIKAKGTIKGHDLYKGDSQTSINRVALIDK